MKAGEPYWKAAVRCIAFLMVFLLGHVVPAGAHANLERSVPLQDAELKEAPGEIRIQFTENIDPKLSTIVLENEKGAKVSGQLRSENGNALILKIGPLEDGIYKVRWQVLSVDTHVTEGSYRFTINAPLEKSRPSETISLDGDPDRGTTARAGKVGDATADVPVQVDVLGQADVPGQANVSGRVDVSERVAVPGKDVPERTVSAEGKGPEQPQPADSLPPREAGVPETDPESRPKPQPEGGGPQAESDDMPSVDGPAVVAAPGAVPADPSLEPRPDSSPEPVTGAPAASDGRSALVESVPERRSSADTPVPAPPQANESAGSATGAHAHEHDHDHGGGSHEPIDWRAFARHALRIADVLAVVALTGFLFFRDAVWGRKRGPAPWPFSARNEKGLALISALLLLAAGTVQVWLLAERLSESGMYPLGERARMLVTSTLFGASAWLRPAGAMLIFMLAFAPERDRQWAGWLQAVAACGLIVTFPLTGHAFADDAAKGLAVFSHTVHMLTSAFWFGGLAGLFAATHAVRERTVAWMDLNALLTRFSVFALPLIGAVAASGIGLTVLRLGGWADLTSTGYGRLALVKSGLLLAVLIIAAFHRLRFMPRIRLAISGSADAERMRALRSFVFGVRTEIVLAAVLFVLAGMLSTTAPPVGGTGTEPVYWHEMGKKAHMSLRISPEGSDRQLVRLDVWLPSGLGAPAGIELRLQGEADDQPAISRQVPLAFVEGGPDPYGYEGFHKYTYEAAGNFMAAGTDRWNVAIRVTDSLNQTFVYDKTIVR